MANESMAAYFTADERDSALPLMISGIGVFQTQGPINRPDGYGNYHLFRCIDGRGRFEAGDKSFTAEADTAVILLPGEPHRYAPETARWQVDWITFSCAGGPGFMAYLGLHQSMAIPLPAPELLAATLRDMEEAARGQRFSVKALLSAHLYKALVELSAFAPAGSGRGPGTRMRLEPVLRYIDCHYAQPLTLETLARKAGVSPQHLCLLFQQLLHTRPFQYVNTLRVNKSKSMLLEDRSRPVSRIAADCGFENICYFNQTFRRLTGLSPTGFRALH